MSSYSISCQLLENAKIVEQQRVKGIPNLVKVVYVPQKVSIGTYFLLRILYVKGGRGNPSAPIDVNVFCTTNFRS